MKPPAAWPERPAFLLISTGRLHSAVFARPVPFGDGNAFRNCARAASATSDEKVCGAERAPECAKRPLWSTTVSRWWRWRGVSTCRVRRCMPGWPGMSGVVCLRWRIGRIGRGGVRIGCRRQWTRWCWRCGGCYTTAMLFEAVPKPALQPYALAARASARVIVEEKGDGGATGCGHAPPVRPHLSSAPLELAVPYDGKPNRWVSVHP